MKLILNELTVVFVFLLACQPCLPIAIELNSRDKVAFAVAQATLEGPVILVSIRKGQVAVLSVVDTILEVASITVSVCSEHVLGPSRLEDVILEDTQILGAIGVGQVAFTVAFASSEHASIGCVAPGHSSFTFDPIVCVERPYVFPAILPSYLNLLSLDFVFSERSFPLNTLKGYFATLSFFKVFLPATEVEMLSSVVNRASAVFRTVLPVTVIVPVCVIISKDETTASEELLSLDIAYPARHRLLPLAFLLTATGLSAPFEDLLFKTKVLQ